MATDRIVRYIRGFRFVERSFNRILDTKTGRRYVVASWVQSDRSARFLRKVYDGDVVKSIDFRTTYMSFNRWNKKSHLSETQRRLVDGSFLDVFFTQLWDSSRTVLFLRGFFNAFYRFNANDIFPASYASSKGRVCLYKFYVNFSLFMNFFIGRKAYFVVIDIRRSNEGRAENCEWWLLK